ncbi:MAG: hypothetical protein IKW71_01430 [Elusimicrobiaceae bacterium]|nr:hypothetical protein [Elusimicrobiaceae bacterium]
MEEKPTPGPKKPSRWPIVVAVICFLFLGTVTGVMPVEKIPFLRNLAYAMGFTKTDTARMSFLRALLTWTDNTVGIPGVLGGSGLRGSWWARLWGKSPLTEDPANTPIASLSSRLQSGANSKTSLIDIAALQALQRQTVRQPDSIRGAVPTNSGDETQPNPAPVRDSDVNVRTESNQDKSDVYFGSDASAQGRNMQDGYDSSGTLKKLANPHVANGRRIDWMTNTAHRMIQLDAGLGGLNRQLSHASVNWQTGIQSMGEEKPHRDLYHAWITSRMAKYTSNLMLSKALADTGFMGAEMPTTAANVLTGGVQVDVQSFQEDQEAWKEYLEFEKKCKKEQEVSGGRLENSKQEFRKLVTTNKETNWDFPKNCVESRKDKRSYESTKFYESLSQVQGICKQLDSAYKKLESECRMVINYTPCKDIRNDYKGHWEKFSSNCNKYFEEDFEKWWEAEGKKKYQQLIEQQGEQAARKQAQNDFENNAWANTYGTRHTEEEYVRGLTNNGSTMVDVVVEQNGGASGYMPSVDPAASIKQYLEENKAM